MNGKYVKSGDVSVWVCEACLNGTHISYGTDHRIGEQYRRDCKNVSNDNSRQCWCNPDWPELMEAINEYKHSNNGDSDSRNSGQTNS